MTVRFQQPWERVRQAGVRIGGPNGAICGFLWEEAGRYHFSYLPTYNGGAESVALDPFRLPLGWGVASSSGLTFDGPLLIFGLMQPGAFAEATCFRWLHERMQEVTRSAGPVSAPQALSPLTRLVWASHVYAFKTGSHGLFFDPLAPWPEQSHRMWMPDRLDHDDPSGAWTAYRQVMTVAPSTPHVNWIAALARLHAEQAEYDPRMSRSIIPFPGSSVRCRLDVNKIPGFVRMEVPARGLRLKGARQLRIRAAYLELARRCGIRTVRHHLQGIDGNNDVLWVEKAVGGPIVPLPTLEGSNLVPSDYSPDDWLVESTAKGVYMKNPPIAALVGLSQLIESRGERFDKKEAFTRICFATITGLFWNDTSPLLVRPAADTAWSILREGCEWRLAPLSTLKPSLLPYKTALAMQGRLTKQAMRYAKIMGLSSVDAVECLVRVSNGLKAWDELKDQFGLNEFELEGARPAVLVVPPPIEIDGVKRRGRRSGALAAMRNYN